MGYEKWLKGIIGEAIMDCRLRGLWCDLLKNDCQHVTPYHVILIVGFVLYWCHVYSACFRTFIKQQQRQQQQHYRFNYARHKSWYTVVSSKMAFRLAMKGDVTIHWRPKEKHQ